MLRERLTIVSENQSHSSKLNENKRISNSSPVLQGKESEANVLESSPATLELTNKFKTLEVEDTTAQYNSFEDDDSRDRPTCHSS
ncbi:hypothetical protein NPIL_198341 [Nephila pilipes]|uniref:Uncharacterized protein n=1 Tax=Nephila pilipes TaxID=299642 RepID=A0A8X6PUF2_NEPPI|nr:hypothetical protein NPIL_198341 [Nephila pilipes]